MKKTNLIILFLLIMGVNSFGAVLINDIVCGLNGTDGEKAVVESDVIVGAAMLLKADAHSKLCLAEYELSSNSNLNYSKALDNIRQAITFLKLSRSMYQKAYDRAQELGVNEQKRMLFSHFDYSAYFAKNQLDLTVANEVRNFLVNMDIIGIYNQQIKYVDDILDGALVIESELQQGIKPQIKIIRSYLHKTLRASMWGSYATLVGGTILLGEDGPPNCSPTLQ